MANLNMINRLWLTILRAVIALLFTAGVPGLLSPVNAGAKLLERIVAIVNNEVILLSEFEGYLRAEEQSGRGAAPAQVLDEMVDRLLILQEARRFRIIAPDRYDLSEEEMKAATEEYIDRRIKAFIHVSFRDVEQYYRANKDRFPGSDLYEARERIEEILVGRELKSRIKNHSEDLRRKAYVRMQLEDGRQ